MEEGMQEEKESAAKEAILSSGVAVKTSMTTTIVSEEVSHLFVSL
jgi:hypothetical protein